MKATNAFAYIDTNRDRLVDELVQFLRIPSISAHKERDSDVEAALNYDRRKLESLGFRTEIWPTRSHAGLFAERMVSPELPTVLIYGHVDVQPVDPLSLWTSPPFEPRIADGKIWARGADDNKGQHYAQIVGVEASLRADGDLPVNVKFILESDEEYDGEAMAAELPKHASKLACDVFVVSDSNFPDRDHPAVTLSLRGIQAFEITIRGQPGTSTPASGAGCSTSPSTYSAGPSRTSRISRPGVCWFPASTTTWTRRPRNPRGDRRTAVDDAAQARAQGVSRLFHEEGYTPLESGTYVPRSR
jgi:acetylornithine deacetylase/succinyl-diaminopimelate desuccinylase-like protein